MFDRGPSDGGADPSTARGDDGTPDQSTERAGAEDPIPSGPVETAAAEPATEPAPTERAGASGDEVTADESTTAERADSNQRHTATTGPEPGLPGFTSGDQDFGGSFSASPTDTRPAAAPPAASPSAAATPPAAATHVAPDGAAPPDATVPPDGAAPPDATVPPDEVAPPDATVPTGVAPPDLTAPTAPASIADTAAPGTAAPATDQAAPGADQQHAADPAGDERAPTRSDDVDGSASSGSSADERPAPTVTIDPATVRQHSIADLTGRDFVFSGAQTPSTGSTDTADAATPARTGTHVESERDADGNLVASTSVTYDDDGNEVSRMVRTFDADGNVTSAATTTTNYSDDGALESRSTTTIENGVRVTSSREEYGSDGALTERSDTTYDDDGDAETRVEIYYGAGGVPDTQRTITFDDDGNAYQDDYQIADGRTGTSYQPGEHVRTTRNDDGTVTRETTRAGDDGQLDYRHVEVTDERGQPMSSSTTLYGDDGEPTQIDEFTYRDGQAVRQTSTTYDDEGRYVENKSLDDNVEVTSSSRTSYDHEGNVTDTEYTRYGPDGEVTYQGDEPPPAPDLSHLLDERVADFADMDPTETTVAFGSALDGQERPTIDRDGLLAGVSASSNGGSDDEENTDDDSDSDGDDTVDLDEVAALRDDMPRDLFGGPPPTPGSDRLVIGETEKHLADVGDPSEVGEMPNPKLYEPIADIETVQPDLTFPKVESTEPVSDEFLKVGDVGDPSEVGEMPTPKLYEPIADIETVQPDIGLPAVQQMPADPVADAIDSQHDLTALDVQPVVDLGDVDLDRIADLDDGLDHFGG